jgi:hypothetical protein
MVSKGIITLTARQCTGVGITMRKVFRGVSKHERKSVAMYNMKGI